MFKDLVQLETVQSAIQELLDQDIRPVIVGIDGRCASGKTSLAEKLAEHFGCDVIHADDFYLRKEQRTLGRLSEPGGNIDRERMMEEIFGPLGHSSELRYRAYDCTQMCLGEEKRARTDPLLIIEGAYSHHPVFEAFYDLKVFVDIDPISQMFRLVQRNGADMAEVFQFNWIPKEEKYLENFNIRDQADIIL